MKTYILENQGKGTVSIQPEQLKKIAGATTSSGGTTGDYIPLAGTEEGKPVTGKIQTSEDIDILEYDSNSLVPKIYVDSQHIYSSQETIIGEYLGKPLYRKKLSISIHSTSDENGYRIFDYIYNINDLNIDIIHNSYFRAEFEDGLGKPLILTPFIKNSNSNIILDFEGTILRIKTPDLLTTSLDTPTVFIEYTKTTD